MKDINWKKIADEDFDKNFTPTTPIQETDWKKMKLEDRIYFQEMYDGGDFVVIDGETILCADDLIKFIQSLLQRKERETIERCVEALPKYEHHENKWCEKYDKKFKPCAGCLMDKARLALSTKNLLKVVKEK